MRVALEIVKLLWRSRSFVAERGDVLAAKRRLGFAADGRREHFVVLQSDAFTIDTVVVAPLDHADPIYDDDPLVVEVTAREAGTKSPQVVLVAHLRSVLVDRFDAGVVGKLRRASLMRAEDAIVRLLDLQHAT